MRVVRSFSRQQAEVAAFTTNGHMMARQEIFAWWSSRGNRYRLVDSYSAPRPALLLYWGGNRVLADADRLHAGLIQPGQEFTTGDLVAFSVIPRRVAGADRGAGGQRDGVAELIERTRSRARSAG